MYVIVLFLWMTVNLHLPLQCNSEFATTED